MRRSTRSRLLFLGGFSLYFGSLWLLWETPVVYPLKVFVVLLHEISHGIAAVATGGSIQGITLSPGLGGACYCPGGNAFVTLSAGYLGSLAWGAVLLELARRPGGGVNRITRVMGVVIMALTVLYVRGTFGLLFGVAFGAALVFAGSRLSVRVNRTFLTALGLTSCLYAILDIKGDVLDRPQLPSDAHMLAELTGVPTQAWGGLWISVALVASGWLFLRAYRAA